MVSYARNLIRGSAFLFSTFFLAAFVAYFTRIILARSLSPSEYGLFYSVFAFVSLFMFFRDLGLNQAISKYTAEFRAKKQYAKVKTAIVSAFTWQLISTLIFGALIYSLSGFLGANYFKDPSAAPLLKIFVLYVLFSMFVLLMANIFQGHQRVILFSLPDSLTNVISFIFIVIFLNLGLKVFAPAYALTLSWFFVSIILLPFFIKLFRKYKKYKISNFKDMSKTLFSFGLPVILTSVGAKVISRIDTLTLVYFTTLDKVGIYNVVLPTAMLFLYISDSLGAVAFPMISELWAKNDKTRLKEWVKMIYKYMFVLLAPLLLSVFAFSSILIRLFFGESYVAGATALQILLIATLFYSIARLNHSTLSAIGKPGLVTKIILSAALINLFGNIALIPRYGIEGAAIATAVSYFIVMILSMYYLSRYIKVKLPIMTWLKTAAISAVFVFTIYLVKDMFVANPWIEIIVSLTISSLVYLLLIYKLNIIDVNEIKKYVSLAIK